MSDVGTTYEAVESLPLRRHVREGHADTAIGLPKTCDSGDTGNDTCKVGEDGSVQEARSVIRVYSARVYECRGRVGVETARECIISGEDTREVVLIDGDSDSHVHELGPLGGGTLRADKI